jgi:predicted alpha/beta superfamily hydrolase
MVLKIFIYPLVFCILFVTISWWCPAAAAAGVKTGKLVMGERLIFHSKVLEEDRILLIGLPRGYQESKRRYHVLYLLDAEFFFQQVVGAVRFLSEWRYLGGGHRIPQLIIVGIVNVDRNRDYTPTYYPVHGPSRFPTSGGGEKFLKFFETELIPLINARYRTQPYKIITGWSFGGLFTVRTFLEKPDLFEAYLAVSPSLWWNRQLPVKRAAALIKQGKISTKPLVVTLGDGEMGGDMGRSVDRGFVPLMKKNSIKGLAFTYVKIPDASHSFAPYKAFYEGLQALYADWVLPGDVVTRGVGAIETFYADLSKKYGHKVEMPESSYLSMARALFSEGKKEEAMDMVILCVQRYPESSYPHYQLGRFYQQQNKLEPAGDCYRKASDMEKAKLIPDSEL